MTKCTARQVRTQAGFGIIEIMIALLLGIFIMLGVTEIATKNSRTSYELENVGRQIENATSALRLLEGEMTNAAFWGERRAVDVSSMPPLCPAAACDQVVIPLLDDPSCELNWAMGYPVQGGRATIAQPDFSCPTADDTGDTDLITPKIGTDYVAIRRASSCAVGDPGCAPGDTSFHLQVDACFKSLTPEDTERVKISSTYVSDLADFDYRNRDCGTLEYAPIYRFISRIYYVNDDDQLIRAELDSDAEDTFEYTETPLVDNVEVLRLEYGLDTSGDGQEDAPVDPLDPYPTIANDTRWSNVIRITISMVVRSGKPSAGFQEEKVYTVAGETYCAAGCDVTIPAEFVRHRRQLYTRTVSLRNVAGRRW